MHLKGDQWGQFHSALLSAFPSRPALARMVQHRLGRNLNTLAGNGSLADVVEELIETIDAEGHIEQLIFGSLAAQPDNPELRAFAHGMLPPGLTAVDAVVLQLAGDRVMARNADVPSMNFDLYLLATDLMELAAQRHITADAVWEALKVLGEQQYITRRDYKGEPDYARFSFTVQGFAHYGRKHILNYMTLVDRVAAHLVNTGDDDSSVIAQALGQSHMLVKQILRWLGEQKVNDQQLIEVAPKGSPTDLGVGMMLKVFSVSVQLQRKVRAGQSVVP